MRDNTRAADETPNGADASGDARGIGGLLNAATDYINSAAALIVLEGRLAAVTLIVMLAAGLITAVLLVSGWLLVLAAIAFSLVQAGWPWHGVLIGMALANIVVAGVCTFVVLRLSRNLLFTATRRTLLRNSTEVTHVRAQTHAG
jgi:hypothetical protein